jgi:hypothetical protein
MPGGALVRLGHQAKIRINGQPFGVNGGEIRWVGQVHDVTDTEADSDAAGNTYEDATVGLIRAEVTLEFQFLKGTNVHQAPFALRPGTEVALLIYADGLDMDPYSFPIFLIGPGSRGLALRSPQAGRLQGQSRGRFLYPGDF